MANQNQTAIITDDELAKRAAQSAADKAKNEAAKMADAAFYESAVYYLQYVFADLYMLGNLLESESDCANIARAFYISAATTLSKLLADQDHTDALWEGVSSIMPGGTAILENLKKIRNKMLCHMDPQFLLDRDKIYWHFADSATRLDDLVRLAECLFRICAGKLGKDADSMPRTRYGEFGIMNIIDFTDWLAAKTTVLADRFDLGMAKDAFMGKA